MPDKKVKPFLWGRRCYVLQNQQRTEVKMYYCTNPDCTFETLVNTKTYKFCPWCGKPTEWRE